MESDSKTPEKPAVIPIDYKRLPDDKFFEGYANNVVFESSTWDLRLIFGKLDQSKGTNTVVQHSAITLPWSQVKAGIYLLQVHLAFHEAINGKVYVPKGIIRPPTPPTEDQEKTLPHAREIFEFVQKLFRQFSEANPEAL